MKKTFFAIAISVITIFSGNSAFALNAPSGLDIDCCGKDITNITSCCLGPTFKWTTVTGARRYTLRYISTNEPCATVATGRWHLITEEPAGNVGSYSFAVPEAGKPYCWSIVASNDTETSAMVYGPSFSSEQVIITPPPCTGSNCGGGTHGPITISEFLKALTLEEAVNNILNFLFFLALALAVIMILYAAFLLMTSHGNDKQVTKAKTIMTWTILALAIILLAKGLSSAISGIITGSS